MIAVIIKRSKVWTLAIFLAVQITWLDSTKYNYCKGGFSCSILQKLCDLTQEVWFQCVGHMHTYSFIIVNNLLHSLYTLAAILQMHFYWPGCLKTLVDEGWLCKFIKNTFIIIINKSGRKQFFLMNRIKASVLSM